MKTLIIATLALCAIAYGQTATPAATPNGDPPAYLIHGGVTFDYATKQPGALTAFSMKIADIAGVPTYSYNAFETANIKTAFTGRASLETSQSVSATTGILQLPFRRKHWGVFVLSSAGVVKFDLKTLSTFNGGGGVYFDLLGIATKDKYHGWFSPMFREIAISGVQIKPAWGAMFTTVFGK